MGQEMTKIPSTGQNSISVFDNEIALLYFDFLTMKMTKLDLDFLMQNVHLSLILKWYKNHLNPMHVAQDIAKIPQGVKVGKLVFHPMSILHFMLSFYHFKPLSII